MSTPRRASSVLGSRTRLLSTELRRRLADLLLTDEFDLSSTAELREALGLGTPDAAAIAAEFRALSGQLGREVARGVIVGICGSGVAEAPPQLVWTAPGAPAAARRTAQVAADLVASAEQSLMVVGYALSRAAAPFIVAVAKAAARGVSCTLVADRMDSKLATLVELWPSEIGLPPLWTRPADPNDEKSALHAKFIIADGRRLLLTSANLTYHGFHGNIEVGVLLEGPVAAQAEGLVREWSTAGLIRRVGARSD